MPFNNQSFISTLAVWWGDAERILLSSLEDKAAIEKFREEFSHWSVLPLSHGVKVTLKNVKYFTLFSLQ